MIYRFEHIKEPDSYIWEEMRESADQSCFFTKGWDDYVTRMGHKSFFVSVSNENSHLGYFVGSRVWVGIWVVSAPAMGMGTYAQGLCLKELVSKEERVAIYQQLVDWLYKTKVASYVQISDWQMRTESKEWIDNWQEPTLSKVGIHYDVRQTYFLELQKPIDVLWSGMEYKSCRYAINKARREGLEVRETTREEDIDDFVKQHCLHIQDVLRRKRSRGFPFQKQRYLSALCHSMFPVNIHMLQVVWKDEQGNEVVLSSGIFVVGKSACTYYTGASYQRYMHLCPNELMVWEAIRIIHEDGGNNLIFGGIARYKRKFGTSYAFVPVMIFSKYRFLLNFRNRLKKIFTRMMHRIR